MSFLEISLWGSHWKDRIGRARIGSSRLEALVWNAQPMALEVD